MASVSQGTGAGSVRDIAARLERLPYTSWHTKMRVVFGTAWFFDAFDSIALANTHPVLIGAWKINFGQIGDLLAIGFLGQLIGSLAAGWFAERWGRVSVAMVTLLIFTLGSFACAAATDYQQLFWIRFVQGIGLGGEVPIMAAYVNEFAKAERRGRFSIGIQILFAIGLTITALSALWIVPHWGWQAMFIIGGIPALLVLPMRSMLPESPRWLASHGRLADADASIRRIEAVAVAEGKVLPPLPRELPQAQEARASFGDLFKGIYARRTLTLWGMWIGTYIITYGLTAWAPSLFRTVFKLDLQTALNYGFVLQAVGLCGAFACILLIDVIGRKALFSIGLLVGCVPLLAFAFIPQPSAQTVLIMVSCSFLFITVLALGLATFTAENYPNHMRALGGGVAGAWQRGASVVGPIMVGHVTAAWGLNWAFVVFGAFALAGGLICVIWAVETRGKVLEQLSPIP